MSYHKVDGVDYSKEGIEQLREEMIRWRDEALGKGLADIAIVLTHVVALMHYLLHLVEAAAQYHEAPRRCLQPDAMDSACKCCQGWFYWWSQNQPARDCSAAEKCAEGDRCIFSPPCQTENPIVRLLDALLDADGRYLLIGDMRTNLNKLSTLQDLLSEGKILATDLTLWRKAKGV